MPNGIVHELLDWRRLVWLSDAELGRYDVALVNLACAEDLPGADEIDTPFCLRRLDEWAEAVGSYTRRLMPQFHRKPHQYQNSEAYFRALCLITVLQRDLGVKYNPAKTPADAVFDTADLFVHGAIQGSGGTCGTLPVVYAAVGRRLRYPVKLANARRDNGGHLFARWEVAKTGERFNIEASGKGLTTPPDDYYRTGLYELSPEVEKAGCLLETMTPRMELAGFLSQRAWRWEQAGNWRKCVESWLWSVSLDTRNRLAQNSLVRAMQSWEVDQRRRMPERFPRMQVLGQGRFYPELPIEVEDAVLHLSARENVLADPQLESQYWGRMRRGDFRGTPTAAMATFKPNEVCDIRFQFSQL